MLCKKKKKNRPAVGTDTNRRQVKKKVKKNRPLENLYSTQGFYKDLAPLPFCFSAIFFQTVSHPRVLFRPPQ
jgi:hypothetical protein